MPAISFAKNLKFVMFPSLQVDQTLADGYSRICGCSLGAGASPEVWLGIELYILSSHVLDNMIVVGQQVHAL